MITPYWRKRMRQIPSDVRGVPFLPVVMIALTPALLLAAATPRRAPHTASETIHQENLFT
jgi:hypothetical protein